MMFHSRPHLLTADATVGSGQHLGHYLYALPPPCLGCGKLTLIGLTGAIIWTTSRSV